MDCRTVRELADSFLSEQLLVETNHELLRHLETCPDCRTYIAERRVMRDRLRGAFNRAGDLQPRPELTTELVAKLRPSEAGMISRRSVLQSWWALAAGLVAAAGGGLIVRQSRSRSRLAALARAAAGDHQNCAVKFNLSERPIPLEEAGRRFGAPYTSLATFELPPVDGMQPLARHSCVYQERRYGHLVFRYRGAVASLLVTEGVPPSEPELEPGDSGPAVASMPAGRFVAFVVADLDRQDVLRLAQAFAEPLSRHLA